MAFITTIFESKARQHDMDVLGLIKTYTRGTIFHDVILLNYTIPDCKAHERRLYLESILFSRKDT